MEQHEHGCKCQNTECSAKGLTGTIESGEMVNIGNSLVDFNGTTENSGKGQLTLDTLPAEVLISIVSCLRVADLSRAAPTCTVLYGAATDDKVWEHRVRTDYDGHLLLAGRPTNTDLARLDRTWQWFYRACANCSQGQAQLPPGVLRQICAGDRGPDGALDGPGIRAETYGDSSDVWYVGRWTAGLLSGHCRIVKRHDSIVVSRYEGEAADGEASGHGEQVDGCGTRYVGQWRNSKLNGTATEFRPDGTLYYTGDWVDDMRHGRGRMVLSDGAHIEGEFVRGHAEGHATFVCPTGCCVHTGMWHRSRAHGPGRQTFQNGTALDAVWDSGAIVGDVRETFSDGAVYEGPHSASGPHGMGRLTTGKGTVQTGRWEDGYMVGTHMARCRPSCKGRVGHEHPDDARTLSTITFPPGRVTVLVMPNGDRLSFDDDDDDHDDGAHKHGTLRYTVSDGHPVLAGRVFVCAGRRVFSSDRYHGFGVARLDGPDAVAIAKLFASGWACYCDDLLKAAAPDCDPMVDLLSPINP